jgi:RNA polymerase sigma-70 factor (ECF subfamily)
MHSHPAEATRPSLLLRIRDSANSQAWYEFVDLYGALIHDFCVRRGLQAADAAEVTQDVLLQVSQSITRFEYQPARGKFRSWLAALTRSKMIQWLRHHQRQRELLSSFESDEPAGQADGVWGDLWRARLTMAALRQVQQRMSVDTFAAFRSAWIEDQPVEIIARQHDKDAAWVYVAKSRGLRLLRDAVLDLSEELPEEFPTQGPDNGSGP